ncbi:MAG: TIR domain-containing protein [Agitococcus sp.]|nr:TIR domain-containing protein [Agitococcus sp.]
MKAFLSHSSLDKEFVREVASKLGRLNCIFDERSFNSGEEFKAAIEQHLENSSVFVFFATKNSLESFWCQFEIEEAFYLKLKAKLDTAVVYIIDQGVNLAKIPSWLRKALIKTESSPALISRDIKHHLEASADKFQRPIFLGRSKEREVLEECLNPIDGSERNNVVSIFGLPGVGRRSLIKSSIKDLYSLSKCVEIELESGDNANTLCAKLADIIEPYSCQNELKDLVESILSLDEDAAIQRSIRNISNIISSGELPIIIDEGGAALDNGCLNDYLNKIVKGINKEGDAYLVFVLNRRISFDNEVKVECISVEQLSDKATAQLLHQLAKRVNLHIDHKQINELTDYIHGYPPAANFLIKQASIYSIDALMSDKRKLTQFSQKRFISHIQDHNLKEADKSVLRVLSIYSPLSLSALLCLYDDSKETAHDRIYEMIDCSLIRVQDGQLYTIADPIKGSVNAVFGYPITGELEKIVVPLSSYISEAEDARKLELSRVLFRLGFALNDSTIESKGISLQSDYIKLLQDAYYQRRYKEAVSLGFEAVERCPDNSTARNFLIKSLIQEEKWDAAQKQIDDLYPIDEYRNIYFLQGFLERKRGNIKDAITAFLESEKHKRKGFALQREFAHCYLMIGDFDLASTAIEKALRLQPDNSQVIDMAAKIAIKNRNEDKARKYIERLALLDSQEHFNVRLSAFNLAFGYIDLALEAARDAVKYGGDTFFSGRVQLIKALTKKKKLDDADTEMSALNADFPRTKNDVRLSLQSSILLEKGDPQKVLKLLEHFSDKNSKQYKGVKKACLEQLVANISIDYDKRKGFSRELVALEEIERFDINDVGS